MIYLAGYSLSLISAWGVLGCFFSEQASDARIVDCLSPVQEVFSFKRRLIWEAKVIGEPPAKRARWKLGYRNNVIASGRLDTDRLGKSIKIRFDCPVDLSDRQLDLDLVVQWQLESKASTGAYREQRFALTILPVDVASVVGIPHGLPKIIDPTGNLRKLLEDSGIDSNVQREEMGESSKEYSQCLLINASDLSNRSLNQIVQRSRARRIVVIGRKSLALDLEVAVENVAYGGRFERLFRSYLPRMPECLWKSKVDNRIDVQCATNKLSLVFAEASDWSWCVADLHEKNSKRRTEIIFLPADVLVSRDASFASYLLASTLFFED